MNFKTFRSKKEYRIASIVVLSVLGFFLLITILLNPILNGPVKNSILSDMNSETMQVKLDNLGYSVFSGRISLDGLEIIHHTESDGGKDSIYIKVNSADGGLNLLNHIFSDGYQFSGIDIYDVLIRRFILPSSSAIDSTSTDKPEDKTFSFIDSLSKQISHFSSGSISINRGNYYGKNLKTGITDSVLNFSLHVKEVLLDSSEIPDKKLKAAEEIDFSTERMHWYFDESLYALQLNDFRLSTDKKSIAFNKLRYAPFLDDDDFFAAHQYRTDRFIINVNEFTMDGMDFTNLVNNDTVSAEKIVISNLLLDGLTNMRLPEKENPALPKMPDEIIGDIPLSLDIAEVEMKNGNIYVKELYPYDSEPGVLLFGDVYASIYNIKTNGKAHFDIKTKMTGTGDLQFGLNLGLTPGVLEFDYSGSLGAMDPKELNKFITVSDRVKVTSGNIKSVEFSIDAYGDSAKAIATPLYTDLSIEELDEETGESSGIMEKFNTFIANTFVIRKENPDDGETKTSNIVYAKLPMDTFLQYVWIALRKAVGDVVGFQ